MSQMECSTQKKCEVTIKNGYGRECPCVGHCPLCQDHILSYIHFGSHLEKKHGIISDVWEGTGIYGYSLEEGRYYSEWHP